MPQVSRKIIKSHDGLDLYYEIQAVGADKPTLFFLHGVGGDLDAWRFIQNSLPDQDFSTIAMDLRGHGHSGHPRSPENYQMANLVSDIITIIDQEKLEKIILIGHSFGAVVAYRFAIENPEKIEKLILISPLFTSPSYLKHPAAKKIAHKLTNFIAKVSPKPVRPGHSIYPVGKFHKDYEWAGLIRTIFHNSLNSYLLSSKLMIDIDDKMALEKLPEKTLIIAGAKDSIALLADTQRMQKRIPGSKLEVIPEANHVVILNNSAQVSGFLLDFIQ